MKANAPQRTSRILIIDDNPSIHDDIRKILAGDLVRDAKLDEAKAALFGEVAAAAAPVAFLIESAYQGEEGFAMVRQAAEADRPYELAFVDVRMPPGWDGIETISHLWKVCPDLQVVICTAYSDYPWEDLIRKIGLSANLVILKKPFDNIEVIQLAHALTEKWQLNRQVQAQIKDLDRLVRERTFQLETANDQLRHEIADRTQAEQALRLSEERFAKAFRASPIPMAIQSLGKQSLVVANDAFLKMTGWPRESVVGRTPDELGLWLESDDTARIVEDLRSGVHVHSQPRQVRTKTGDVRDTLLSAELLELGTEPFALLIVEDITEQLRLEHQLRQAQKMEAVGQLAAGVAHDFNNILTVILGNASLLSETPQDAAIHEPVKEIRHSAERATSLVRQLLAFSRKQIMQALPLDLGRVVVNFGEILRRVLGEQIVLQVNPALALPLIDADLCMMEQVIINLAVNARDAMPRGGHLTIATTSVEISAEAARRNPEARPGRYVSLRVTDTGCGMAPEIQPRIFEPFFTTKATGHGTGLGLATVYGIVKQHDGWIEVESVVRRGSTFRLFFPVCTTEREPQLDSSVATPVVGGNESILVVEDEAAVRQLVAGVLRRHGYRVWEAAAGADALSVFQQREGDFDMLLTDMVMPGGIAGRDLASRLLEENPSLRVAYMTGYSATIAGKEVEPPEGFNLLLKPFSTSDLLRMVRQCLDAPRGSEPLGLSG